MFGNFRDIEIFMHVDDSIYVTTDQVVTISLIVNELLQNIFDHAYLPNQSGKVQIIGKIVDSKIILRYPMMVVDLILRLSKLIV